MAENQNASGLFPFSLVGAILKTMKNDQPGPKTDPPVKPEKDIPVKPDTDPDPTKKKEHNDPTRIDDPPPVKPNTQLRVHRKFIFADRRY